MNSFYSTLYNRFSSIQIDQSFSCRLRYPTTNSLPTLKIGDKISDCIVGIPKMRLTQKSISYGIFDLPENEFGEVAAVRACLASTVLLSAKSVVAWIYRDYAKKWIASRQEPLRAQYVMNVIFDTLARKRVRQVEGAQAYKRLIRMTDILSSALFQTRSKEFSIITQMALASSILRVPMNTPRQIAQTVGAFQSILDGLTLNPNTIFENLKSRISMDMNNKSPQVSGQEISWEQIEKAADALYAIIVKVPGKWHDVYLPYSHALTNADVGIKPASIFDRRVISRDDYLATCKAAGVTDEDDAEWLQICYELMAEEKRNKKMEDSLTDATKNLNFANAALPKRDFISYFNLYTELLPNIRRMTDRVRQVKNALDDNLYQESGTLDLQLVIQNMATKAVRSDVFARDENLSKDESWTILIDSSLSLSGSSRQIKAIAICLAESANQTLGMNNPWAMFAFSDEFYCIKDYTEQYDNSVKARIGGLRQSGLSYIPDALRAATALCRKHAKDKNFIILVSDGLASGYPGIESDLRKAILEVSKNGINLAAIGVGTSTVTKVIRNAKLVDEPTDLVKGFMDLYTELAT